MKNIYEILEDFGLEIPAEKKKQIFENGVERKLSYQIRSMISR